MVEIEIGKVKVQPRKAGSFYGHVTCDSGKNVTDAPVPGLAQLLFGP